VDGRILRQLRESKARSQADVARSVGISPAHLARLETNQRGLYVEDFVNIAEALGEKPGNLLPNDLGDIGYLKPLIDRLTSVDPEFLSHLQTIIEETVLLIEDVISATQTPAPKKRSGTQGKRSPAAKRKTKQ
jgi:transcriptional regulator with XRE-family HTH domain